MLINIKKTDKQTTKRKSSWKNKKKKINKYHHPMSHLVIINQYANTTKNKAIQDQQKRKNTNKM